MKYINKTRFFSLFLTLTLLFLLILSYAKSVGKDISDAVVRLHVVANSNSAADQNLKLRVRDRIIKDTSDIFIQTQDSSNALQSAIDNLQYIKSVAEDEIRKQGFNYAVNIKIGNFSFPTKVYDNITLPAGKYNAVRIEIGEAKGENWWCVLYPPLCYTEGTLTVSDTARNKLKSSLSSDEYELITQNTPGVEIKFKIVEWFQNIF